MRFDEAFDILVEHCAQISPGLNAAERSYSAGSARMSTYGNDVWIAGIVRSYWTSRIDPNALTIEHYLPFYDAAWELCRVGVLRPGPRASMGYQAAGGGGTYSSDGYSITEFGCTWLEDPDRRTVGDPSRLSEIFVSFDRYGPGFAQRTTEAIRCHRGGNYLAACVMAGAAAESILLAVAVRKVGDETKVLKDYGSIRADVSQNRSYPDLAARLREPSKPRSRFCITGAMMQRTAWQLPLRKWKPTRA
jgi:hypothetical protein